MALLAPILVLGPAPALGQTSEEGARRTVTLPDSDIGERQIESRREAQFRTTDHFEVDHDFSFTDRIDESGIRFRHYAVEDAGKHYKMVHYDHGNAVLVADVDGDDRLDIYFLTQAGRNELWRNLGEGRFEDITDRAGVGVADRISVAGSFGDIDNDGDPDLFVTTVKMGNLLFENDGRGRFTDISSEAGVDLTRHSSGAVFFDYDRDGLLDLFVTNVGVYTTGEVGVDGAFVGIEDAFSGHLHEERTEASVLYRNLGGKRFRDVSKQVGLAETGWSGDATATDFDADNDSDLYVLNMQGDDHYYENVDGESFVERTDEIFPRTPWGSMGIKFFDYNNDGRTDLFLTDMHSDMSKQVDLYDEKLKAEMQWTEPYLAGGDNNIFGNAFYENQGEAGFEEISGLIGAENYWPWGLSVGDLNADGYEDVFIASSMSYPWRYGVNSVLLNNRGKQFLDSEFLLGVEPRRNQQLKTFWFALDCSAESDQEHRLCEGTDEKLDVYGNLGTRSSVLVDIDEDGDLDIITSEFHAPPQILISDLAQKRPVRALKVRLVGSDSNRDGLGSRVVVRAGGVVYTRFHDGKSGYLSQSSAPLYFGLGEASEVESVEVFWPSGRQQRVAGPISLDGVLEIVEPPG